MYTEWADRLSLALVSAYKEPDLSVIDMSKRAAVLALIVLDPEPALIYTLRARHLNQHAGEVCFPGGKFDPVDSNLCETALRETREEIGLPAPQIQLLGALPPRMTRSGMLVHPYVGLVPKAFEPRLNHHELELMFTVPLAAFAAGVQVRTDVFEHHGQRFRLPVYHYAEQTIWGFTAGVTQDLLSALNKC